MEHTEIVGKLAELVTVLGSQRAAALKLGITQAYLSDLILGKRKPGPRVLKALGIERDVTYREIT